MLLRQTLDLYKLIVIDAKADIEETMASYPSYFAETAARLI
jgi:hypothetical protein